MRHRKLFSTIRTVGRFGRAVRRYAANVRGNCPVCDWQSPPSHGIDCDMGRGARFTLSVEGRPTVATNPLAELL